MTRPRLLREDLNTADPWMGGAWRACHSCGQSFGKRMAILAALLIMRARTAPHDANRGVPLLASQPSGI